VNHALGQGALPRRHGVKPHINMTTTLEGLKNEVGAPPAELELSLPISTRTLERILLRLHHVAVLLADSMVIDVGGRRGLCQRRRCGRCGCATRAAGSPAAIARSAGRVRITWIIGREAGRATCPTLCCSAITTIGWCMRVDGR